MLLLFGCVPAGSTLYAEAGRAPPEPDPPGVVLNEVVSRNDSTWDGGDGSWPDWVEIYNASAEPVPLAHLALADSGGVPWLGGEGTLEPGARHVIIADGNPDAGPEHAPFALDGDGDELTL
ncbi:MAG: lamin tail domain-containing protein, partial [Deltaproteobacteria bacterium]|nr:lamin tail domain-containing protein [Deltaproteobacteria bacterium]